MAVVRKVPEQERLAYDVAEAGLLLGMGRSCAYEAVKNGTLPAIRIGGRWKVPKIALQRFLESAGKQN